MCLPPAGEYGVGMIFLPTDPDVRRRCEHMIETVVRDEGQRVLGWRTVPVDNSTLGRAARESQPVIRQLFVGRGQEVPDLPAFERKLYVIRKRLEQAASRRRGFNPAPAATAQHADTVAVGSGLNDLAIRQCNGGNAPEQAASRPGIPDDSFYVASLSHKTIVYKGMLTAEQLPAFYPDLTDPSMETALALVHSRFSTNTFPSWSRAHPYRYVAHNGEINTLRGNVNWMRARERLFASDLFGPDVKKIVPVIDENGSDSAMFDNALEMLILSGRSLPHAMMMMIPEPWTGDEQMSAAKRAFYEYHACLMEPWDGPASIAFTDGVRIGAVLDRNGLRPSRYYVTKDGLFVLASEVGVLEIPPEQVLHKGRLQPGRMLLLDLEQGRIVGDDELKHAIASEFPYRSWLDDNLVRLEDLPEGPAPERMAAGDVLRLQQMFGYTTEDLKIIVSPMATEANEPLGSMGTDTPLAVLSDRPQLLYNYFKQLFAQVTNPPVDAIREELIMSIDTTIGAEGNLLAPGPESARQIKLRSPILTNEDLAKLQGLDGSCRGGFKAVRLPTLFPVDAGTEGLERALAELCTRATDAIAAGHDILVLSDRGADPDKAAIPALLAVAAVHHHLIREGTRTLASLVLETGEPREVHHFALLIGYGASAVNPYLAFETIGHLVRQGEMTGVEHARAVKNYTKAVEKGVVKIMSKMGISTVQSYRGAQIFEAIGLGSAIVDRYFTGTPSRVGGIGLDILAQEIKTRHEQAFPRRGTNGRHLDDGGQYQWRQGAELHLFNPQTVHKLQYACRTGNYEVFKQYSKLVNDQSERLCTLRGLFELKFPETAIPIEEVEPVESIVRRFKSGAMSYGSISQEAHETLAIAMNRIGGKSNTGEGGEDPARYTLDENGDSRNSAIKQIASARFGVTSEYLVMANELQIKMAQGAKPGEGGNSPATRCIRGSLECVIRRPASGSSRRRPTTTFTRSRTWPS